MAPPNRGPIVSKPVSGDYDSVFLLLYALRNPYQQFIWRDFNKETKKKKKNHLMAIVYLRQGWKLGPFLPLLLL
jgi:hypothetical protein